jgi:hypothetical protein
MSRPHPLTIVLATFLVAFDTVAFRACLADGQSRPAYFVLEYLLFSQTGLLWIWASVGKTRASIRISTSMVATVAIVGITPLGPDQRWFVSAVLFAMGGGIVGMLGLARFFGWRLVLTDETASLVEQKPLQFSLRSVMECVTGLAILLTLCRVVYSGPQEPFYVIHALPWFLMFGLISGVVSATAFSVVFSRGPVWARCLAIFLVTSAAWFVAGGPRDFVESFGVIIDVRQAKGIPLQAVLTVGSLLIVRLRGYQFVRRAPGSVPASV